MAEKQVPVGDGLTANLAGMTKNQLYDIMSQMKTLIEQNQQQARQILIQNPLLTKALFQAQIMLGMVQPPQAIPNIQPPVSQPTQQSAAPTQQSAQPTQQPKIQAARSLPSQLGIQNQTGAPQTQTPMTKQQQNQPAMPVSASVPAASHQSQPATLHPLQPPQQSMGHLNPQGSSMSLQQPSQHQNFPQVPLHSAPQPPSLQQTQKSAASSQLQQPLQTTGTPHMPLQPPMPPQPRLPSMPSFHHQYAPQMGPNVGFQPPSAPQHLSQPMYHAGTKPPANTGPSFLQGQPPLPSQAPPQSLYQAGGQHFGTEFNNQVGNLMQADRGSSWMSGPPEAPTITQLPGPPSSAPGLMGPSNQPSRAAPMTTEMEKALLQQVMSLTQEQINLLPPEQRNQVLQLQQMLRQ
ncbi:hydroxyproline-rich glycoprotein [Tripterygium wilfordii]|uniref:Hydroxyproline-rich glycoprotein n=1 Tax=Tripterygium wilfordii TaxID=458696 RepID=A0A7J7CIW7_TRIWF|nr:cleavage stimulating factor 64 [Tripterygium wilfordii]KAF5733990.1 hydroxyproline-rich glycoprotein [Tripterygium wilfordii]